VTRSGVTNWRRVSSFRVWVTTDGTAPARLFSASRSTRARRRVGVNERLCIS